MIPLVQEVNMTVFKHFVVAGVILAMALGFSVSAASPSPTGNPSAQAGGDKQLVNINTAGVEQLDKLPRIGAKVALRIIDYRKKNGSFKRIQDLMNVKGIGPKVFEKLQPLITV